MNKKNFLAIVSLLSFNSALALNPAQVLTGGDSDVLRDENLKKSSAFIEKRMADAQAKYLQKEANKEAVKERNNNLSRVICSAFDTSRSAKNHPLYVEHTKASCDLGLKLPGIPDFAGIGIGKFDLCSAVQSVTSEYVDAFNKDITGNIQGVLDEGMGIVNDAAQVDLNEVASGAANIDAGSSSEKVSTGRVELDVRKPLFNGGSK